MAENMSDIDEFTSSGNSPFSLPPFAIQLLNVVPIEIVARRFPVESSDISININLNLVEISIDSDSFRAQVILEIKLEPSHEPRLFEIFSRIVGLFSYSPEYESNKVQELLQQGSLNVLLPFVRELVVSLSTRLQIPPIMLSLVQFASPPDTTKKGDTDKPSPEKI